MLLAIVLDLLGAYVLSKKISSWVALVPLAIIVGVASAFISSVAMRVMFPDSVSAIGAATTSVANMPVHAIFCIGAIWFFRRGESQSD